MPTQHKTTHRDRETTGQPTERITFRAAEAQLDALEALVERGVFPNRSAAIREAIDELVPAAPRGESDG